MSLVHRRRSPGWVRSMSSRELHGLAGRLQREFTEDRLSARQEWLLDAALSELEYRHRSTTSALDRCWCWFCRPLTEWSLDDGGALMIDRRREPRE